MEKTHKPVLLHEVLETFSYIKNAHLQSSTIVDATLGLAGHASELVKQGYYVVGIDTDKEAIRVAEEKLSQACPGRHSVPALREKSSSLKEDTSKPYTIIHGNFRDIESLVRKNTKRSINGVLIDLGVNSPQLVSHKRGFSFQKKDALLDMRLDQLGQAVTAAQLLNTLRKDHLVELFLTTMTRGESRRLVDKVIAFRKQKLFECVGDLLSIIPSRRFWKKTHPATKPFLALRMAVNSELENTMEVIPQAFRLLEIGGILTIISFHSSEDRIVKDEFRNIVKSGKANYIVKKPVTATQKELDENNRARSAKLRAIQKI